MASRYKESPFREMRELDVSRDPQLFLGKTNIFTSVLGRSRFSHTCVTRLNDFTRGKHITKLIQELVDTGI